MARGSKKAVRVWSYLEALRTVPYVRLILGSIREKFVTLWHLFKDAGYDARNPAHCEEMRLLHAEAVADLEELNRLGIMPYECPRRGIALFPFVVADGDTPRQAYFVYKDSRDRIDSFILNDELWEHNDLLGDERPVKEEWRQVDAMPKLEEAKL